MQIVKQLFDVGELFNQAEDLITVRRVYQKVFDLENIYRGGGMTASDSLHDTLDACLSLSLHRLKGVNDSSDALMLEDGARKLTSHLVNHRFNLDAAKLAAAKTALVSKLIKNEDAGTSLEVFRTVPSPEELRKLKIDGEWERLNRLMSVNPEAFWYWYQASILA